MSITKGAMSATLYRVGALFDEQGTPSVDRPSNDFVLERLSTCAFRDRQLQDTQPNWGFCGARDVLDTEFSDINEVIYDRYVLFALRQDRKRLSAPMFKARLQRRVKAWCQENGRARCPSSVRGDLEERLTLDMLGAASTDTKTWQALWHLDEGWVLFDNNAQGNNERFVKLFVEAFGLTLRRVIPLDLPEDDSLRGRALLTGGMDYRPGQPLSEQDTEGAEAMEISAVEDSPVMPHLAGEFLLWLWYRTELSGAQLTVPGLDGPIDLWGEKRVVIRPPDSGGSSTTVVGENPCAAPECLRAMEGGKLPAEMRLCIRRDDREFAVTLGSPDLQPRSVSLPQVISGSDEEALYDRMFLYEELRDVLAALFGWFLSLRVERDWASGDGAAIQRWLASGGEIEE